MIFNPHVHSFHYKNIDHDDDLPRCSLSMAYDYFNKRTRTHCVNCVRSSSMTRRAEPVVHQSGTPLLSPLHSPTQPPPPLSSNPLLLVEAYKKKKKKGNTFITEWLEFFIQYVARKRRNCIEEICGMKCKQTFHCTKHKKKLHLIFCIQTYI